MSIQSSYLLYYDHEYAPFVQQVGRLLGDFTRGDKHQTLPSSDIIRSVPAKGPPSWNFPPRLNPCRARYIRNASNRGFPCNSRSILLLYLEKNFLLNSFVCDSSTSRLPYLNCRRTAVVHGIIIIHRKPIIPWRKTETLNGKFISLTSLKFVLV